MTLLRSKTFRERLLDPRNRRSKNIEDRRRDIALPVRLPVDETSISPHERDVARYRAEDARSGRQTDEIPVTVKRKRGLRNVRTSRQ